MGVGILGSCTCVGSSTLRAGSCKLHRLGPPATRAPLELLHALSDELEATEIHLPCTLDHAEHVLLSRQVLGAVCKTREQLEPVYSRAAHNSAGSAGTAPLDKCTHPSDRPHAWQ